MTSLMFPRLFPHSLGAFRHKHGRRGTSGFAGNWLRCVVVERRRCGANDSAVHAPTHRQTDRQTEKHRKTIRWTLSSSRLSSDDGMFRCLANSVHLSCWMQCNAVIYMISIRRQNKVVFERICKIVKESFVLNLGQMLLFEENRNTW